MSGPIELTRILISKLCHDLAGSMGAAGNAIDFLESENLVVKQKAFDLISFSITQAISDLKFFREIYGAFNKEEDVNIEELKRLSDFFVKYKGRISSTFNSNDENVFVTGNFGRLILCFLPIASGALINNGQIKIDVSNINEVMKATICAKAKEVKENKDINGILLGNSTKVSASAANAHYIFTRTLITELKVSIIINKAPDCIEYIISSAP